MRMIVVFEKGEPVRHIGHLDLMRSMQRALRRSGLSLQYSKGFNPHIQLSFAYPLSVGVAGRREVMDVPLEETVAEATFVQKMNEVLPPPLHVVQARSVDDNFPTLMSLVAGSSYTIRLDDGEDARLVAKKLDEWMALKAYTAMRKTKSGTAECDVRPFVLEASAEKREQGSIIRCLMENTNAGTLKPSLFVKCLCEFAGVEAVQHVAIREAILARKADGSFVNLEDYSDGW